jgi:hypothetical protein
MSASLSFLDRDQPTGGALEACARWRGTLPAGDFFSDSIQLPE